MISAQPTSVPVEVGQGVIHVSVWDGTDPPTVFLHPNRTDGRTWDFVIRSMTSRRRALAMDYRGHGRSSYPDGPYSLDAHVGDVVGVLERLATEPVVVVGAATGGNLVLLLASDHQELVSGIVVIDPGLSLERGRSRRVQAEILGSSSFTSVDDARAAMPNSQRFSEAMRDHVVEHSLEVLPDGSARWRYHPPGAAATEAALEEDLWHRIAVRCPALVVRGSESPTFPSAVMGRLLECVPHAEAVTVHGAGHRVAQDAPEATARLIDGFLRALP